MIILCTEKEKAALIKRLSPENCGCIDCPVFDSCHKYTTCEEALEKGIFWSISDKRRKDG